MAIKPTKNLINILFFTFVVLFFGLFLWGIDFNEITNISVNWSLFTIASMVALIFRYWGVYVWRSILIQLGAKSLPSFFALCHIYAKAWMGRYIPGKIAWIAGKICFASQYGISKSRLAASSVLEGAMQIVAISSISLLFILIEPNLDVISTELRIVLIVIIIGLGVMLVPKIFNKVMSLLYKVIKNRDAGPELSINKPAVIKSFFLYTFGALISGTAYFLLTLSIAPETSLNNYLYIIGAFNLAGAVGMAAVIAPSGIGVRDGVLLVLLAFIFPRETALVITIISRLWSSFIDVFFISTTWLFNKYT